MRGVLGEARVLAVLVVIMVMIQHENLLGGSQKLDHVMSQHVKDSLLLPAIDNCTSTAGVLSIHVANYRLQGVAGYCPSVELLVCVSTAAGGRSGELLVSSKSL